MTGEKRRPVIPYVSRYTLPQLTGELAVKRAAVSGELAGPNGIKGEKCSKSLCRSVPKSHSKLLYLLTRTGSCASDNQKINSLIKN